MNASETLNGSTFDTLTLSAIELNGLGLNPNGTLSVEAFGPLDAVTPLVIDLHGTVSIKASISDSGEISGRNFRYVTPDGASHMNSRIIVTTFEGETLLVKAQGSSFMATGPMWWETSRTVSNLPRYAEAARRYNVGVGSTDVQSGQIIYDHFSLFENPFPEA